MTPPFVETHFTFFHVKVKKNQKSVSSEKMILHTYDLKITFQVKKYRKTVNLIGETTDSNQSSHSSHSF